MAKHKIREILVLTYDLKQWFKLLKKDLNKHGLTEDEKSIIYIKLAKGLYNESIKLSCPKDILQNEISVLKDLVENG